MTHKKMKSEAGKAMKPIFSLKDRNPDISIFKNARLNPIISNR